MPHKINRIGFLVQRICSSLRVGKHVMGKLNLTVCLPLAIGCSKSDVSLRYREPSKEPVYYSLGTADPIPKFPAFPTSNLILFNSLGFDCYFSDPPGPPSRNLPP